MPDNLRLQNEIEPYNLHYLLTPVSMVSKPHLAYIEGLAGVAAFVVIAIQV